MSPEKSKELIAIYPSLFLQDDDYIECGDGWFELLKDCITKIKEQIEKEPLELDDSFRLYVSQIKEKYGTLRFYLSFSPESLVSIIDEAEKRSEKTCEECGKPGSMRSCNRWWYVACDECEGKRKCP